MDGEGLGDCRRRPAAGHYAVSRKAMRPTAAVKNGAEDYNVEGAEYPCTGHSVAHCCTLNAEKTGMRVQHPLVQDAEWHVTAPSAPDNHG